MTQEQLERKMADLECEVAELRREIKPLRPLRNVPVTFGMLPMTPTSRMSFDWGASTAIKRIAINPK